MTEERIIKQCQNCGNITPFKIQGTYSTIEVLATRIDHVTKWTMLECMTCSQPMLEQTTQVVQHKRGGYEETYEEWDEILEETDTIILYPKTNMAGIPLPSPDMPTEVAEDYEEARAIFGHSP